MTFAVLDIVLTGIDIFSVIATVLAFAVLAVTSEIASTLQYENT